MGCGASHEPHYFQPGNYIFVGAAKPHGWREGYKVAFILLEDGSFKVGLSKYTWFHDSDQYQWVDKPEDLKLSEGTWSNVAPSDTEPGGGKITYFEAARTKYPYSFKGETDGWTYELTVRSATSVFIRRTDGNGGQGVLKLAKDSPCALLKAPP